jgi:protoporphyrinogen oxidase
LNNCSVLEIRKRSDHSVVKTSRGLFNHPLVVNTLPLNRLASLTGLASSFPQKLFGYRHLYCVFITLDQESISDHVSLYFPDRNTQITRAHEPRNRWQGMSPAGKTSLLIEIPIDELGQNISGFAKKAISDLHERGFIEKQKVMDVKECCIPNAYPVIKPGCENQRQSLLNAFESEQNILSLGRNARFSYLHCHDIYLEAKTLAEKLPNTLRNLNFDQQIRSFSTHYTH